MARRLPRLVLAALTLNATLLAAAFAAPSATFACVCVAPAAGQPIFDGSEQAVLVGRVGRTDPTGKQEFAVDRWFKGGAAGSVKLHTGTEIHPGGITSSSSCGINVPEGAHIILAAAPGAGFLSAGACSPWADLATAEGQAMLAAAVNTFGVGLVPGEPPPEAADNAPAIDLASVAILAVVGLVAIVAAGVVISAVGRRERPAAPKP